MSVCHVLSSIGTVRPPFWGGAMSRNLEGVHVGLMWRITRQRAVRQKDGTWRQVEAETVLEKAETQPLETYIDRRQATVAEWVTLCPILEVCDRETGYEGGGRLREPWWRKMVAQKQLSAMLKDISTAVWERRWKSGRRGGSGGGTRDSEESEYGAGSDGFRYAGTETDDAQVGE